MKKLFIILLMLLFVILLFMKCSKKPIESNSNNNIPTEIIEYTYSDTLMMMTKINEILSNASKGSSNPLAQIGGFYEELETIKNKSESIITDVVQIVNDIDEKEDSAILLDNSIIIADYNMKFDAKFSDIKTAKQNTNISSLKSYLSEMIEMIDEYRLFLDELTEDLFKEETSSLNSQD